MKWDRFHVSQEALKPASFFSKYSGFQPDTRVTKECWVRQPSDPSLSLPQLWPGVLSGSGVHPPSCPDSQGRNASVCVAMKSGIPQLKSPSITMRPALTMQKELSSFPAARGNRGWRDSARPKAEGLSLLTLEVSPLPPGFLSPFAWLSFRTEGESACVSSEHYS